MTAAHLENADLSRADLNDAYLYHAHLEGADLSTATGLISERLECATTDARTKLPPGVSVPPDQPKCHE